MTALNEQIGGSHYKEMKIQPIEFILANNLPFPEGCVIKYVCRHPSKGGREDLEKAKQCIDFIIEHYYPEKKSSLTSYSQEDIDDAVKSYRNTSREIYKRSINYPTEGCENCIIGNVHLSNDCKCDCHNEDNSATRSTHNNDSIYRCVDCKQYFTSKLSYCPICHKETKYAG